MLCTWNIANFGVQKRREKDHRLIAEMLGWFDLIAVQEVADNLADLYAVRELLPDGYRLLISDTAGNDERTAFVYDAERVELLELVGRLSIAPSELRHVRLEGVDQPFQGFDRSPYLAAFESGSFRFTLASVHLFFGSDGPNDMGRRSLEAYAVARWADLRRNDSHSYTSDIIALGDFKAARDRARRPDLPRADQARACATAAPERGRRLEPRWPSSLRPDRLLSRRDEGVQRAHRAV